MNTPSDVLGCSCIVSWKEIAGDFLEEFVRIQTALIYSRTPEAEAKILKALSDRDRYDRIWFSLSDCGYYYDHEGIWHHCGWGAPGHLKDGKLQLRTTAPPPQRIISMRTLMEAKEEESKKEPQPWKPPAQKGPIANLMEDFIPEQEEWEA